MAAATQHAPNRQLDTRMRSSTARNFEHALRQRIIGQDEAVQAARRKFSPEFMNRLDKVVVFQPLKREELYEVLDIELRQVQKRVEGTASPFLFRMTNEAREILLQEGTDRRYGARHLKRAIERYLVSPIARLLASAQVRPGDGLLIDRHPGGNGLAFLVDTERRSASARMLHGAYLTNLATAKVRG